MSFRIDEDFASENQVILASRPTQVDNDTITAAFYVTSLPGNALCGDDDKRRRKKRQTPCKFKVFV